LIVFYKFSDYIRRRNIKRKDIIENTGISSATLANMTANKGVSTETISKLCAYLKCQPQDIMEFQEDITNEEN
jgi:DNA-binding Xre family transcriptional regulator